MNEFLNQALEDWKGRGFEAHDRLGNSGCWVMYRGEVAIEFYLHEKHATVAIYWPMHESFVYEQYAFGDEFASKAAAKVNEWLDVIDGPESGEIVRRIVEVRNALRTVPLSPDIVKHKAAVEAMEYLVKRLMGGDGA